METLSSVHSSYSPPRFHHHGGSAECWLPASACGPGAEPLLRHQQQQPLLRHQQQQPLLLGGTAVAGVTGDSPPTPTLHQHQHQHQHQHHHTQQQLVIDEQLLPAAAALGTQTPDAAAYAAGAGWLPTADAPLLPTSERTWHDPQQAAGAGRGPQHAAYAPDSLQAAAAASTALGGPPALAQVMGLGAQQRARPGADASDADALALLQLLQQQQLVLSLMQQQQQGITPGLPGSDPALAALQGPALSQAGHLPAASLALGAHGGGAAAPLAALLGAAPDAGGHGCSAATTAAMAAAAAVLAANQQQQQQQLQHQAAVAAAVALGAMAPQGLSPALGAARDDQSAALLQLLLQQQGLGGGVGAGLGGLHAANQLQPWAVRALTLQLQQHGMGASLGLAGGFSPQQQVLGAMLDAGGLQAPLHGMGGSTGGLHAMRHTTLLPGLAPHALGYQQQQQQALGGSRSRRGSSRRSSASTAALADAAKAPGAGGGSFAALAGSALRASSAAGSINNGSGGAAGGDAVAELAALPPGVTPQDLCPRGYTDSWGAPEAPPARESGAVSPTTSQCSSDEEGLQHAGSSSASSSSSSSSSSASLDGRVSVTRCGSSGSVGSSTDSAAGDRQRRHTQQLATPGAGEAARKAAAAAAATPAAALASAVAASGAEAAPGDPASSKRPPRARLPCCVWYPGALQAAGDDSWYLPRPPTRRLFVGNIGCWVDEAMLLDYFGKFGNVVDVQVMWNTKMLARGRRVNREFAFISYSSALEAARAVHWLDGCRLPDMEKDGNGVTVEYENGEGDGPAAAAGSSTRSP